MIPLLVRAGLDVNAKTMDGSTPLHVASGWYTIDAIQALLDAGADVNATNDSGETPLDLVEDDVIQSLLLEHGAKSGK